MLYLLKRKQSHSDDEYDAKVVRAPSERLARKIANLNTGDEGQIWADPERVTIEVLSQDGASGEILGSFNAG